MPVRVATLGGLAVIVLLALIAYWPALEGGFIWDDPDLLWNSDTSSVPGGWYKGWMFWSTENTDYWPLTSSVFWAQWHLFGREHLIGYHLLNVMLHILSAVLIWRLLRRLKVPGSWLIAAMFTVHPACVPSVAWITELKNTLSMVLFLLTLLLYVRFDEAHHRRLDDAADGRGKANPAWPWYAAAVAAFFLTLAAKTSTIMLPVLLLGIPWWRRSRITLKDALRTAPFFLLSGFFAWTTMHFQHTMAMRGIRASSVPENFFERICIAGRAVWFYIWSDLFPARLSVIYTRWSLDEANILHWIAPVMVLVALGFLLLYRRAWTKPLLAAFGYILIVLLPVLGFFDMSFMYISFVADHLQYLAIPAVLAVVVGSGWWLASRGGIGPRILAASAAAIVLALMLQESNSRAASFKNERALWADTIKRNKNAWFAYNGLGFQASAAGRFDIALGLYDKAIALKPDFSYAFNGRGLAYAAKASAMRNVNQAQAARFDDLAIASYDKALECDPQYAVAYSNKGFVYQEQKRFSLAVEEYNAALAIEPRLGIAYNRRGLSYAFLGRNDEAIADFTNAIASIRKYSDAYHNRALLYHDTGQFDKAIADLAKVLEYSPRRSRAYFDMGVCYLSTARPVKAVEKLSTALKLMPNFVPAYEQRGLGYMAMGQRQLAIRDFETVLRYRPNHAAVREYLLRAKGQQ